MDFLNGSRITSNDSDISRVSVRIDGPPLLLEGEGVNVGVTSAEYYAPYAVTFFSTLSTLAAFYFISTASELSRKRNWKLREPKFGELKVDSFNLLEENGRNFEKSTVLPGYGILGDRVNEVIELFLDTLAIYVHNDGNRDCPRRMLCEANQRAADYGIGYGMLTYMLSLSVSFLLRGQRVSESMEAMRRGRHGMDCRHSYPRCPFSL